MENSKDVKKYFSKGDSEMPRPTFRFWTEPSARVVEKRKLFTPSVFADIVYRIAVLLGERQNCYKCRARKKVYVVLINPNIIDASIGEINTVQIPLQATFCFGMSNAFVQSLLSVFIRNFLAEPNTLFSSFGCVSTDIDFHTITSFQHIYFIICKIVKRNQNQRKIFGPHTTWRPSLFFRRQI